MNNKVSAKIIVPCNHGLHLRPATMVVRLAQTFSSEIHILNGSKKVDAKSVLDLLINVGPCPGKTVELQAVGRDAEKAVQALVDLFTSDQLICDEKTKGEIYERKV